MWYDNLFNEFINSKNAANAVHMSAYMKNQFEFLGLKSGERRAIANKYFKEIKRAEQIERDFIQKCWDNKYREFQYTAVDYLYVKMKYITDNDIAYLKELITAKSWWDSVDGFDRIFAQLSLKYPSVNDLMLSWSEDDNKWVRRSAIIYQLKLKEKTNTELLEKILCNSFGTSEFFINKAIGWALREYSKTNSKWVRNFIEKYSDSLSNLSIREGSKYI